MTKFWILAGPCRAHSIILTYTIVMATKEKYSLDAEVDLNLGFPTILLPGKPYMFQALAFCCSIRDNSLIGMLLLWQFPNLMWQQLTGKENMTEGVRRESQNVRL